MEVNEWFEKNRFKASSFSDVNKLVELKKKKKVMISVVIPTKNEQDTIGKIVKIIKKNLVDSYRLVDEIIVIDSGSKDKTRETAKNAGAVVYSDSEILKRHGTYPGKGENLWKALHVAKGDIICWVDGDIKNMHPRFIYGLVGPLLTNKRILYTKPFYRRPIKIGEKIEPLGGGRVTEILIRPLFNIYFPRLASFIQPLSGEGAAWRYALERIPYFTGYGVETAMVIDVVKKFGLGRIAQVDLSSRIHRNRSTAQLSNMAFAILQVFAKSANRLGKLIHIGEIKQRYKTIERLGENFRIKNKAIEEKQRPPMITIPEYRRKFKKEPKWLYV